MFKLRAVIQNMIYLFYVHFTSLNVKNLKYDSEKFEIYITNNKIKKFKRIYKILFIIIIC